MMRQVSHKHIVYLYGVCVRDVESKCICFGRGGCSLFGECECYNDNLGLMPPSHCLSFLPLLTVQKHEVLSRSHA